MEEDTRYEVLAIGGESAKRVAESIYGKNAEYDMGITKPPTGRKKYDAIVAYNVLNMFSFRDTVKVLKEWKARMKDEGLIYIYVPAMEWVAEQVVSYEPSRTWRQVLFGNQRHREDHNMNAFTMMDLRSVCEDAGIDIVRAEAGFDKIAEDITVREHLVVGVRHEIAKAQRQARGEDMRGDRERPELEGDTPSQAE